MPVGALAAGPTNVVETLGRGLEISWRRGTPYRQAGPPDNTVTVATLYQFGPFRFDVEDARLKCHAAPLEASPRALAVLHCLLQRAGRLVRKQELLDSVWGRQAVSDAAVRTVINEIRSVLRDDARRPTYIETVPRQGYRFIAPVADRPAQPAPADLGPRAVRRDEQAGLGAVTGSDEPATSLPGRSAALAQAAEGAAYLFVGRSDELAALDAWHRRAARHDEGLMLVSGEPGIGKSHLLRHFLRRRQAEGSSVAIGRCIGQVGAGEPYLPVLDALSQWCQGDQGAAWVRAMHSAAPAWWQQLRATQAVSDPEPPPSPRGPDAGARGSMPREFAALLEALPQGLTPVLMIDDLHWSDQGTLDLLRWLLLREAPTRLLVVASYSPAETLDPVHPLHALRHALRQQGRCTELALQPFSQAEVAALAAAHGLGTGEPLAAALHAHTGGLPLFVAGAVQSLCRTASVAAPSAVADWAQRPLPDTVAGMIDRQLLMLPPDRVALLEFAAVGGLEIAPLELAEASGREPAEVRAGLGELACSERWLRMARVRLQPGGPLELIYAFRHPHLQRALLARQSGPRRLQTHLAWAQSLIRAGGNGPQRRRSGPLSTAGRVALHLEAARELGAALGVDMADTGRHALGWRLRAARAAVAELAFDDALRHYARALSDTPSPEHQVRIHAERSELMSKQGAGGDALQESSTALSLARAQGDPGLLRLASLCRARVALRCGLPSEAMALTDQLLEQPHGAINQDTTDQASLLTVRASALAALIRTDDAEATRRLALQQTPQDDHLARGRILTSAMFTDFHRADFAASAERARQAVSHFRCTTDHYSMVASSINLGAIEVQLGTLDRGRHTLEAALAQARTLHNTTLERVALINLIDLEAEAADTLRVADLLAQVRRQGQQGDSPAVANALRQACFQAHLMAGELGAAWREAHAWQADTHAQGERHAIFNPAHALPGLLSLLGGRATAMELLAEAGSLCGADEMAMRRMRLDRRSALLDLEAGNPREALARLEAAAVHRLCAIDQADHTLVQARALLALKRPESALEALRQAGPGMTGRLEIEALSLRLRAGALAGLPLQEDLQQAGLLLARAALPMLARLALLQGVCLAQDRAGARRAASAQRDQLDAVARALLQSVRDLPACQRALLRRLPASMAWEPLPVY